MGRRTAVYFVRVVGAVRVAVAAPSQGDADGVGAAELSLVTWREVAVLLIRVVATVVPVITLLGLIDAATVPRAPELVQLTCRRVCHRCVCAFVRSLPVDAESS